MLRPMILDCLKGYDRKRFMTDLTAGTIVGIVAIPLAIAFAIASGVGPEKGLITAVVAGFVISLLGGSRVQIGGPTGAFVIILFGIVEQYGTGGLATATLMAGLILVAMGVSGLGSVIKFIPYPVIVGFTSGIAVVIFTSQIRDLLGLSIEKLPGDFIGKWAMYFQSITHLNWHAAVIAAFSLLILNVWPKINRKLPGSLIAIFAAVAAVKILGWDVETIGSRFGEISSTLPAPVLPDLKFATIQALISPAISIALLGAIEALLSAVVADGMTGGKRHRSNMELVAQGAANIVSPLFGGIPATGAIARTATNIRNGGRTPIAGIIHAVVVLFIMLFLGKWVKHIPLAALGAILVMVSYNMSEWRTFVTLWKNPRSDVAVLLITFTLTVLADLVVAIQAGVVLSVLLFMRQMAKVSGVTEVSRELSGSSSEESASRYDDDAKDLKRVPPETDVYEVNGPFFFGTAFKFEEAVGDESKLMKIRILRMRNVPIIDSSGINALRLFSAQCNKKKITLILSGVQRPVLRAIIKAELVGQIGHANITTHFDRAVDRAWVVYGGTPPPKYNDGGMDISEYLDRR
ncbi:MAG: sulfate permease [Chitinispirillia bacterium]|nr:sulfate permease [Chitinispirillia bacterium]MCL2267795.1 sulfate permease [Chitinispirillia bacterium]